jgi:hypothetical protein
MGVSAMEETKNQLLFRMGQTQDEACKADFKSALEKLEVEIESFKASKTVSFEIWTIGLCQGIERIHFQKESERT